MVSASGPKPKAGPGRLVLDEGQADDPKSSLLQVGETEGQETGSVYVAPLALVEGMAAKGITR